MKPGYLKTLHNSPQHSPKSDLVRTCQTAFTISHSVGLAFLVCAIAAWLSWPPSSGQASDEYGSAGFNYHSLFLWMAFMTGFFLGARAIGSLVNATNAFFSLAWRLMRLSWTAFTSAVAYVGIVWTRLVETPDAYATKEERDAAVRRETLPMRKLICKNRLNISSGNFGIKRAQRQFDSQAQLLGQRLKSGFWISILHTLPATIVGYIDTQGAYLLSVVALVPVLLLSQYSRTRVEPLAVPLAIGFWRTCKRPSRIPKALARVLLALLWMLGRPIQFIGLIAIFIIATIVRKAIRMMKMYARTADGLNENRAAIYAYPAFGRNLSFGFACLQFVVCLFAYLVVGPLLAVIIFPNEIWKKMKAIAAGRTAASAKSRASQRSYVLQPVQV